MTRLLFVTQVLDKNDSVLGAYHNWIAKLAGKMESIIVICLYEGEHTLPGNVTVYSLGKEKGRKSKLAYSLSFISKIWSVRSSYDSVFVHMNQEYVFIGGILWKLLGKRIYLWRNHYAGSFLTRIAAALCTNVFCTSEHSYTARFPRTILMPVGVDTTQFTNSKSVVRNPKSILFLARIAPSKRVNMYIEGLAHLIARGVSFVATICGSSLPEDGAYYASLKQQVEESGLHARVQFLDGVANVKTAPIYNAHEFFVNCSPSGMFDKTLFEAAASGCIVLSTSQDFRNIAGDDFYFEDADGLAQRLETFLMLPSEERISLSQQMQSITLNQDLTVLVDKLALILGEGTAERSSSRVV